MTLRIQATAEQIRARLPASVASIEEADELRGLVVALAERLAASAHGG